MAGGAWPASVAIQVLAEGSCMAVMGDSWVPLDKCSAGDLGGAKKLGDGAGRRDLHLPCLGK